jgi:hypothetical protein
MERKKMIVDIELTRQTNNRYIARALQFPDVTVEAVSRDEALARMREALLARRRAGIEIVQIAIGDDAEPTLPTWPRHAGEFPDDEAYGVMLAEIERQRNELDKGSAA